MEFDKDTPASDEARRLAESKKLTLQPVHADVTPEELDGEMVARHLAGPAIANVDSDMEQNAPQVEPSKGILQENSLPIRTTRFSFIFAALLILAFMALGIFIYFAIK